MNPQGTWTLTIRTPIGTQTATVHITADADHLHGVAVGATEQVDLTDLTRDGDRLSWKQTITRPMRLNLVFDVVIDGDQMTGTSKAGRLPTSRVNGLRTDLPTP